MELAEKEVRTEMSGPALKQVDSHSSIHEAALDEAKQLTELMQACLENGESGKAFEIACVALEHWESRTLAHAFEEEEGLYQDIAKERPEWKATLIALTRDHDLMRQMAAEIREMLAEQKATKSVLERFQAMMIVDLLHNRDEMRMLEAMGKSDEQRAV